MNSQKTPLAAVIAALIGTVLTGSAGLAAAADERTGTAPVAAGVMAATAGAAVQKLDPAAEESAIKEWRAGRLKRLTSETGWLTLAGLYWLDEGENTFGSAAANKVRLENPGLAPSAGSFVRHGTAVKFVAKSNGGITHEGKPVTSIDLVADTQGEPTVLESGPVSFFVIERAGRYGVRVRDKASPHRTQFKGLDYFPVTTDWVFDARFEPYQPAKSIKIINILGMEERMPAPGAIVFSKGGKEYRLDAVLEEPDDKELFVMFADATSGKQTYGAGRFMYIPMPANGTVHVDFNKSYNPPCAFNDFATCPLPPFQNRLAVRVEAGEKSYAGSHH